MASILVALLFLLPIPSPGQDDDVQQAVRLAIAKRYDEALAILHRRLAEDSENAQLNYLIGLCHFHLEDFQRSVRYLQASVANRPRFPKPYYWLARLYLMQEESEKARDAVAQGLKRFPRHQPLLDLAERIRSQKEGGRGMGLRVPDSGLQASDSGIPDLESETRNLEPDTL